ncbi:MAG: hypothetical protein ACRC33_12110 [Gemmataceae bacterium]
MMYQEMPADETLSQGDIIDDCPLFVLNPDDGSIGPDAEPEKWRARVIVLTQACDLTQGKSRVLVSWVHEAAALVADGVLKAQAVRDQVRRGLVWGWYFLPASKASPVLPESLIDLRDLHTVSKRVLERLIADGKRVGRVMTPFREHLAQHFAVTYMRIGLPEPYGTEA